MRAGFGRGSEIQNHIHVFPSAVGVPDSVSIRMALHTLVRPETSLLLDNSMACLYPVSFGA